MKNRSDLRGGSRDPGILANRTSDKHSSSGQLPDERSRRLLLLSFHNYCGRRRLLHHNRLTLQNWLQDLLHNRLEHRLHNLLHFSKHNILAYNSETIKRVKFGRLNIISEKLAYYDGL